MIFSLSALKIDYVLLLLNNKEYEMEKGSDGGFRFDFKDLPDGDYFL